jgi:N4-gp56 family major capsid protein
MKKLKNFMLMNMILNLFDVINTTNDTTATTGNDLSAEMRTFYHRQLLEVAGPELYHEQFGQMVDIPANNGKVVQFRKPTPFKKALTKLTEGVTPAGQSMSITTITSEVAQYGDYTTVTDILKLTAADNMLVIATDLLGQQAGQTRDTIVREIINGGTNVQFGESAVTNRQSLASTHKLTVKAIKQAVRTLKAKNAPRIGGKFVAIINQDVSFDLTEDNDWKYPKQYSDPGDIYTGEIGEVAGVRFVETSEAKIFKGADLCAASRNLTLSSTAVTAGKDLIVTDTIAATLVGRYLLCGTTKAKVTAVAVDTKTITVDVNVTLLAGATIYPGEGGSAGRAVYSTLVLGQNAYGVTKVQGAGLEYIFKPLGSGDDPLNQRATAGWKTTLTAELLQEDYMVRIESCSTYDSDAN